MRTPAPLALLGLATLLSLLPASASVALSVDAWRRNAVTGSVLESTQENARVAAYTSVDLGPQAPFAPPAVAEGYADATGTFWASATTGTQAFQGEAFALYSTIFRRTADDATFAFEITGATLDLFDGGSVIQGFDLEAEFRLVGDVGIIGCGANCGFARFEVEAKIQGDAGGYGIVDERYELRGTASGPASPDRGVGPTFGGAGYTYRLRPLTISVDISSVAIGEKINPVGDVRVKVRGRGGETFASAFARDPAGVGSPFRIVTTGFEEVPEPALAWLLGPLAVLVLARPRSQPHVRRPTDD